MERAPSCRLRLSAKAGWHERRSTTSVTTEQSFKIIYLNAAVIVVASTKGLPLKFNDGRITRSWNADPNPLVHVAE